MIWVVLGMIVAAEGAKLNNAYLPPPAGAKESGGSDGALQLPLEPPYIDRYTPEAEPQQPWRPGTRSLVRGKPTAVSNNNIKENQQPLDDEDDDTEIERSRFISGSYSYTGPDNVLVTVTYTADANKGRKIDNKVTEDDEEQEEEVEDEPQEEERQLEDDEEAAEEADEDIVPTPPTLPAALARAFNFHKRKYEEHQEALAKTHKTKKPLRENVNKRKNQKKPESTDSKQGQAQQSGDHQQGQQHAGQYGNRIPGHHQTSHSQAGHHYPNQSSGQSGYQYPNQGSNQLYGTPTVHQGYSYPKPQ